MAIYERPASLEAATTLLRQRPFVPLAGGTDLLAAHVTRPLEANLLDLGDIAGLAEIERRHSGWRIGAMARWSDLERIETPPWLACLRQAAAQIGGRQVQNAATIVGNVCNASPAADGVPCLLALDAEVELASSAGTRLLPLGAFVQGNRRTARHADELVTALRLPERHLAEPGAASRSIFLKLGSRSHLVISIVMLAMRLDIDASGRVTSAGVAVGACSAVAARLPRLEARLVGQRPHSPAALDVEDADLTPLAPIDDSRATAAYRLEATKVLLRRAWAALGAGQGAAS